MKTHVYDTHVKTHQGDYYHFDVLVSDKTKENAFKFAEGYLASIGVKDAQIDQSSCSFCHSEIASPAVKKAILELGFFIIPMQGCPPN